MSKTWDRVFNVLFLCTGNSARSILAEAILNREGRGHFKAYSAGSFPKGEVHPRSIELLASLGYDTSEFRSKSWDEFSGPDAPAIDFVFTVCDNAAEEVCPTWPGHPITAHWGIPDPAAVVGSPAEERAAFLDAYRAMSKRIALFTCLQFEGLNRMSLQTKLNEIGKRQEQAEPVTPSNAA
jgi:arsenate reductase